MREEELLINRLKTYKDSNVYPFHMPGHKRMAAGESPLGGFVNPFLIDITEIDGFDNLHHPEGILKESMEWAAREYGADQAYYLVNGSTSGILAAVCGCVRKGGKILVSRNCHKAAYHAIYLSQLQVSYLYPQKVDGFGIQGGILAEDVKAALEEDPDIQAVLIVSPTYDGVVSDVEAIAGIVHGKGLPLIVDEAHGAHFRYSSLFPQSALELGADVVIQSVHKTLPSLTQTALLHIKCNGPNGSCLADRERIDRYLHMVQSSSPSYVLMASIENSIFQMARMKFDTYGENLLYIRKNLENMRFLQLAGEKLIGKYGIFDLDPSKIVISTRPALEGGKWEITGAWLMDLLREEHQLEMEMCGADYVTAITTVMDSREGLLRLEQACLETDERIGRMMIGSSGEESGKSLGKESEELPERMSGSIRSGSTARSEKGLEESVYSMRCETVLPLAEAMDSEMESRRLSESAGCVSGEFVYLYPPGIPLAAPGERITEKILNIILEYKQKGLPVQGLFDDSLEWIRVVKGE